MIPQVFHEEGLKNNMIPILDYPKEDSLFYKTCEDFKE